MADIVRVRGIPCTRPVRALFDEMRRLEDRREAVVAMDMMAAATRVSLAEMHAFLERRRSWNRSRQVQWALGLASELSLSPGETRTRLVWVLDARLPAPLVNQPVWDASGRLLAVADLFDASAGVVVEYDGGTHRGAGRHTSDVRREDRCRREGLEYVKVTGLDLLDRPALADRMRSARSRAPFLAGRRGGWTLQPPRGWPFHETAQDVLAHRDWLRAAHQPA